MSLAFWNNPIVVSAFRVKYRRGPVPSTALYLLLLVAGGAVLHYYRDQLPGYWVRNYFLCLMGLQFAVSGLRAVTATSASIKSEVSQRTLDFQRIAALSPRQILLGKLLGEPAQAYLLAVATIPLSVLCLLWGGVTLDALVVLYVQLATTTLMLGALGLLNRLDAPAGKAGGGRGPEWLVFTFVIVLVVAVPPLLAAGSAVFAIPALATGVGLLTPLPCYYGVIKGDVWMYGMPFFGREIPFVFVTPVAQLGIAYLCFQSMVRQLITPLNPPVSRGLAYLVLLVVDVVAAGMIYDPLTAGMSLGSQTALFCLIHLLTCFGLTVALTPWREILHSWVWRFRGRQPWLRDLWLGDRSENGLALLTFAALGVFNLSVLVLGPVVWKHGRGPLEDHWSTVVNAVATTVVLTLAVGTVYQWWVLLAGRSGTGMTMALLLLLVTVGPHLLGYYYKDEGMLNLSPSYHFARWLFGPAGESNPSVMLEIYGLVLVLVWYSLRRRLRYLAKLVDNRLERMGVVTAG